MLKTWVCRNEASIGNLYFSSILLTLLAPSCGILSTAPSPEQMITPEELPVELTSEEIPPASPITQGSEPSSLPKADLSISEAPALNEVVKLTLTVLFHGDAANTTAQIKLPGGATLLSGNLTWQGDLKAGEPVILSAGIVFREAGRWSIEGVAKAIGTSNADYIYLTVGVDHGEFGGGLLFQCQLLGYQIGGLSSKLA